MLARGLMDELVAAKGAVVNVTSIAGSSRPSLRRCRLLDLQGRTCSTHPRDGRRFRSPCHVRVNAISPGEIETFDPVARYREDRGHLLPQRRLGPTRGGGKGDIFSVYGGNRVTSPAPSCISMAASMCDLRQTRGIRLHEARRPPRCRRVGGVCRIINVERFAGHGAAAGPAARAHQPRRGRQALSARLPQIHYHSQVRPHPAALALSLVDFLTQQPVLLRPGLRLVQRPPQRVEHGVDLGAVDDQRRAQGDAVAADRPADQPFLLGEARRLGARRRAWRRSSAWPACPCISSSAPIRPTPRASPTSG